jgi:hypothetical protein
MSHIGRKRRARVPDSEGKPAVSRIVAAVVVGRENLRIAHAFLGEGIERGFSIGAVADEV